MIWVVGDVHGCALELERLLAAVRFAPGRDELWSVGDLVNTGPDSLEALRIWRAVDGRAVLGNHDLHALRVLDGGRRRPTDTLDALLASPDGAELLERLRAEPVLAPLALEPGAPETWLVHAGLRPDWDDLDAVARRLNAAPRDRAWARDPGVRFATRARFCTPEGEPSDAVGPPGEAPQGFHPWDAFWRGRARVIHGHWALRGHHRTGRVIGLDSGCVYGGRLTAWSPEEDRVVQVPGRTRV